jgi:hypothetical protein
MPLEEHPMPPLPTPEAWAHIRHEYEQTRRPIEDICLAHRISANTLRRRVKTWGWTMRRPPMSDEGPPAREPSVALAGPSPHIVEPGDTRPAREQLQDAVARVMRAIETTSARLAAGVHLRETETAARALGSLTRTMRDLDGLLGQHPVAGDDDPPPENMDEFRNELARRIRVVIERHNAGIPARYEAAWHEFAAQAKQDAGSVL